MPVAVGADLEVVAEQTDQHPLHHRMPDDLPELGDRLGNRVTRVALQPVQLPGDPFVQPDRQLRFDNVVAIDDEPRHLGVGEQIRAIDHSKTSIFCRMNS